MTEEHELLKAQVPSPARLRDMLQQMVNADLLGPVGDESEELDEARVSDRYLVGALAPANQWVEPEQQDALAESGARDTQDGEPDEPQFGTASLFPSSFGMTFTVDGTVESVTIEASWGRYERVRSDTLLTDKGNPKAVWKRRSMRGHLTNFPLQSGEIKPVMLNDEQPEVHIRGVIRRFGDDWLASLFLVNGQQEPRETKDQAWLFQVELEVRGIDGEPIFVKRTLPADQSGKDSAAYAEEQQLAMTYRDTIEFAVGHGVAVHAEPSPIDPTRATRITTQIIPTYDVPTTAMPTADDEGFEQLAGLELDMKVLAESEPAVILEMLAPLPSAYATWIARKRDSIANPSTRLAGFEESAEGALERCDRALARIREGLTLLQDDPQAVEAFRFANRAMWHQRIHSIRAEQRRHGEEVALDEVDLKRNRCWRPFQLAFILLNLATTTRLDHPERNDPDGAIGDLLWFPTGGGKTEAYLGLAAYAIGLRRLQGEVGGRIGEYGVTVLMRYTLRLLTLQQFQRATALICACEVIRREAIVAGDTRWGNEPFRIGLWVGQRATPNKVADAAEAIRRDHGDSRGPGGGIGTPAQLTNCPWCGSAIDAGKHIKAELYQGGRARVITYCGDKLGRCAFSERHSPGEGLGAVVVDEEIYRRLPTLLIATVDKFAQMPWNGQTQVLFGQVTGQCPRHGFVNPSIDDSPSHPARGALPSVRQASVSALRPPDLIIQDELHLISGPLGTLVGLYETAVEDLCCWRLGDVTVRPKVIASTATIRQAGDQMKALFARQVEIFPPPGLDAGDNFFSIQRQPSEAQPGRRYLGICAPGRRLKRVLIRVYTAYLAAAQALYERYGRAIDPWMTTVGYFNSMRELGGMRRLLDDDIRSALRRMDARGLATRTIDPSSIEELTSRKSAGDIPRILDQMEVTFDPEAEAERKRKLRAGERTDLRRPLDVLLATNMISVGVDVKRLGLMIVAGQPKATAEYIQATSRVGRSTPGLVCTVYNWARPRDLSHFEGFEHYHACFYKHVEGLSVTPFSARSLDRGLSGILATLVRNRSSLCNHNDGAGHIEEVETLAKEAVGTIVRRAQRVDDNPKASLVNQMLEVRLARWRREAQIGEGGTRLVYRGGTGAGDNVRPLLQQAGLGDWDEFTCLNSLRDVEPTVGLILDTRPIDAGSAETDDAA